MRGAARDEPRMIEPMVQRLFNPVFVGRQRELAAIYRAHSTPSILRATI